MADRILDEGTIAFQAEGRLLQELGLRLVASPEVAMLELIKNSYDADSPTCTVGLENKGTCLVVSDAGHGMTLDDFSQKWMRIATSSKVGDEVSPRYHRRLTGAKGIGRFAVRYLGDHLVLSSVAYDKGRRSRTRLVAQFDWPRLDKFNDLSQVKVDYVLTQVADAVPIGTSLTVSKLRNAGAGFLKSKDLRDSILRMVTPTAGLDPGRFRQTVAGGNQDPGFRVVLPGEDEASDIDLAQLVLDRYWARLVIDLKGKDLAYHVFLSTAQKPRVLEVRVPNTISKGFVADIRFFPRRKGVFSGQDDVHGQRAWQWVRANCGVAVVDHGFRIKPFGFPNDDWLKLDADTARNMREWRSRIAQEQFPIPEVSRGDPAVNPMLNLAANHQLVGAVFIDSTRSDSKDDDLIPAMDREGLLDNAGARQLEEFVRAGVEFLAHVDKAELERLAALEAKKLAQSAREEVKVAIEHIQSSPTLTPTDKAKIIKQYTRIADRLQEQEEYSEQARRSLTTMSLLGVVAGFMTHESKAAVHDLEHAVTVVRSLAKKDPALEAVAEDLASRLERFRGYLDYAKLFVKNVRTPKAQALSAKGQVDHILKFFGAFAEDRGIDVENEIDASIVSPPLPPTVYSGILLNLYTNALKAVIAAEANQGKRRISFRAWEDGKKHVIEVADNGIGIPPELRKRIWDPLYTTTSDLGNPLGSGMGLGLTFIKQVVSEFDGSVSLVSNPPPGFTTCFRVEFRSRGKE